MPSPIVYVVEPYDRVDISPASSYGDIVYLFSSDTPRPSIWDTDYADAVLHRLTALRFNPKVDYILIVGNMATVCLALDAISAHYGSQNMHLKLLLWDARDQQYTAIQREFNEIRNPSTVPRSNSAAY